MKSLVLEICVGTSCHLLGSQDLIDAVEALPAEKKACVDLRGISCLKSCGKGPNVRINGVVLCNMTPEKLMQIIHDNI